MSEFLLLATVFATAAAGTGLLRRYALLDVPNERSSHSAPTPRGGGAAIVVAFLAGTIALAALGRLALSTTVAVVGGGLIVAAIGFVDDHGHVPARWRLLAHFAAAAWAVSWLGGVPPIAMPNAPVELGLLGDVAAAVGLVWLLNLYNFMDGIDGIASIEACTVCLAAAILAGDGSVSGVPGMLPALLGVASLGFLLWNFPPARIFMGDVGSGFLGLTLGILAIASAAGSPRMLWGWVILLGVFIVDATITLFRRLVAGARVYEAHRSHAYQHATRRFGKHAPVTLATAAINLTWLFPWAWLVTSGRVSVPAGVAGAYLPLIGIVLAFRAGRPE